MNRPTNDPVPFDALEKQAAGEPASACRPTNIDAGVVA
jgi:hypothetical protein